MKVKINETELDKVLTKDISKFQVSFGNGIADPNFEAYDLESGVIDLISENSGDQVKTYSSTFGQKIVQIIDPVPIDTRSVLAEIKKLAQLVNR